MNKHEIIQMLHSGKPIQVTHQGQALAAMIFELTFEVVICVSVFESYKIWDACCFCYGIAAHISPAPFEPEGEHTCDEGKLWRRVGKPEQGLVAMDNNDPFFLCFPSPMLVITGP